MKNRVAFIPIRYNFLALAAFVGGAMLVCGTFIGTTTGVALFVQTARGSDSLINQDERENQFDHLSLEIRAKYTSIAVQKYRTAWNRLRDNGGPWENYSVRAPAEYIYALVCSETFLRENPHLRDSFLPNPLPLDRAETLLRLVREMQDVAPDSPTFGNFRWYWRQKTVEDQNAVEFVAFRLLYCWKHRDVLPVECRERLWEILVDAREGLLRRRVRPNYTNISALNFTNLILFGEMMNDPECLEEGLLRMYRFVCWTHQRGIREVASPTYYAVLLEAMQQLERDASNADAKRCARGILDFVALDAAAHFFAPSGRFAGGESRSYNYLHGDPYLRCHLARWGWVPLEDVPSNLALLTAFASDYVPPRELLEKMPAERFVKQDFSLPLNMPPRWRCGATRDSTYTWITPKYSIGSLSSGYGEQDVPLAIDFAHEGGKNRKPRIYFIVDGRGDPCGTKKIASGGGHAKALHLDYRWSAYQNRAIVSAKVEIPIESVARLAGEDAQLASSFVFPTPDGMEELKDGFRLRYGLRGLECRILYQNGGKIAGFKEADPQNHIWVWSFHHGTPNEWRENETPPRLDFVLRVFDWPFGLVKTLDETLAEDLFWREAPCVSPDNRFTLPFLEEPNLETCDRMRPNESYAEILEINDQPVGRACLESAIPQLREFARRSENFEAHVEETLNAEGVCLKWSARDGLYYEFFRENGCVAIHEVARWRVRIPRSGNYYLWAKVRTQDPQHDSAALQLRTSEGATFFDCWAFGVQPEGEWVRFSPRKNKAEPFSLPAQTVEWVLMPREFGAQVEAFILTQDAAFRPDDKELQE
ncbi:MAG: hypothetical protein Q4D38_14495 [Planctomycetia bacterium]|nr:hypothetical protein [Planctomycetia bacterium]